ncbi:glycosyltransferase family 39 protein [Candidatus Pacearchaeota archaeon]|nr:glycosyltransferase family 39 protein [Candidatus Pacearchaeota archaeon]
MEESLKKRKDWIKNKLFGWVKDNYDKTFLIVLLVAFILRILVFIITKDQAMWFDAAEYMSTAKYWAGIGDMSDVWYYRRGFFWPFFGSLFFRLGLGDTAIRFATVLFSTGIVAVSYFLIKNIFNKKYALYACIGLTFSWVMLFFTGRPMTSIPATFFLLLSLLFFWKGYELKQGNKFIYLFALFLAISVLTRMQNLIFLPIFFIFILIKEKFKFLKNKSLWVALLIFILILSPLFVIYTQHFGNPITDIMSYYFGIEANTTAVASTKGTFSNVPMYFKDLPYNLSKPIFYLFLAGVFYFFTDLFLGFDKIFKNKNVQKKFFIFLWIVLPLAILGYMDSYAQQRYTMPQHPFFFLIAAIPFFKIGRLIKKHFKFNKKIMAFLILVVFIVALIPNVIWANQLIENKKSSYFELKPAGEWIKENSKKGDMIITNSFPQISYYSERRVATFGTCYNNPEAHTTSCSEEEFYEFVEDVKPKFLVWSVFQHHEEWIINYLQNNNIWTPVQVYNQGEQPIIIIYESDYS